MQIAGAVPSAGGGVVKADIRRNAAGNLGNLRQS